MTAGAAWTNACQRTRQSQTLFVAERNLSGPSCSDVREMARSFLIAGLLLGLSAPSAKAVLVYQRPSTREMVAAHNDGSAAHVIAHGRSPVVSPNGRSVAFVTPHGSDTEDLRLVGIHGGHSRLLARGVFVSDQSAPFAWSSNSRYVAVSCGCWLGLYLIDVVHHKFRSVDIGDQPGRATFSPNSSSLIVESLHPRSTELVYVRLHHGGQRDLPGVFPTWGKRGFAFDLEDGDLFMRKRVGGRARLLRRAGSDSVYGQAWSADGNTLLAVGGTPPDAREAVLIDRKSAGAIVLSQRFSTIDSLSRYGRVVLGEQERNVVAAKTDGSTRVLALQATSPSWTR